MEYVPIVSYSNFPDVSAIAVLQKFKGKSETSSYMRYAHTKGGVIKIFDYYLFHFIRFILNQKIIDIKTCRLRKRNVHYLTFLDLCNLQQLLVERPVSPAAYHRHFGLQIGKF